NQAAHVSLTTEYVLVYAKNLLSAKSGEVARSSLANSRFSNPDHDNLGDWKQGDLTGKDRNKTSDYAVQSPFTGEFHNPGDRHWASKRGQIKSWLEEWGIEYEDADIGDGRGIALALKGWAKSPSQKERKTIIALAKARATTRLDAGGWPMLYWGIDGLQ